MTLSVGIASYGVHAAFADDVPLVWSASKVGDTAAGFTAGLRLGVLPVPTTVTASTTVTGTGAGRVRLADTPLILTGTMHLTPDRAVDWGRSATVAATYDAQAEQGVLSLSETREWLSNDDLSLRSSRTVRAVASAGDGMGVSASQSLSIDLQRFSTQISTSAVYDSFSREMTGNVGIRRQVGSEFSVNLSIANPWSAATPSVAARFDRKW
ncbi:hypothetical protein [Rhizobium halophytocola]|uniref:Uncharacterized protein n=1 Tax=Rhizobium halophytocola TaxID=735519 RepID=A0ABS4DVS3_9HYPH|nr:hypothetical protein [Rhizobium halophytocola]MBP1849739.1 hypothetical protein [Rhizobium halophytocola]